MINTRGFLLFIYENKRKNKDKKKEKTETAVVEIKGKSCRNEYNVLYKEYKYSMMERNLV